MTIDSAMQGAPVKKKPKDSASREDPGRSIQEPRPVGPASFGEGLAVMFLAVLIAWIGLGAFAVSEIKGLPSLRHYDPATSALLGVVLVGWMARLVYGLRDPDLGADRVAMAFATLIVCLGGLVIPLAVFGGR